MNEDNKAYIGNARYTYLTRRLLLIMKKNASEIMLSYSKHTCMCSCTNKQRNHCQGVGWKEVRSRAMIATLLLWVTTDSLSAATEEETTVTCDHLMQRHGPSHGGAVRKLLFNDGH